MRTMINQQFEPISEKELARLTTIVSEAVATVQHATVRRTLKVVDLWKIQKGAKSAALRRQYL